MPSHSKSKLQAVIEESTSTAAKHPSVTTAVKSMANVLLGPRGKTPIENIMTMQHFQLWGFILVVAGLIYIVWLMQKKLDSIDKQYKEQFVLLHRLFKSHQDLQVEVRKKSTMVVAAPTTTTSTTSTTTTPPKTASLLLEEEEELDFENTESEPEPEPVRETKEENVEETAAVPESELTHEENSDVEEVGEEAVEEGDESAEDVDDEEEEEAEEAADLDYEEYDDEE
jgi:hypothetical protein